MNGRYFWHWDPAFLAADQAGPTLQHDVLLDPVRLGAAASLLRIPTLLIRGGDSDVVSEHDAAQFLRLVPHAEFTSVAGAQHMVAGDDNAVFDEVLRDFIERRIRPRQTLLSEHPRLSRTGTPNEVRGSGRAGSRPGACGPVLGDLRPRPTARSGPARWSGGLRRR